MATNWTKRSLVVRILVGAFVGALFGPLFELAFRVLVLGSSIDEMGPPIIGWIAGAFVGAGFCVCASGTWNCMGLRKR